VPRSSGQVLGRPSKYLATLHGVRCILSADASSASRGASGKPHETGTGGTMKRLSLVGAVLSVLLYVVPTLHAQSTDVVQGTQLHLTLQNGLSTSVARDGDPFTAIVAEPVFNNGLVILPAGTKIHGQVGTIARPKHFAIVRSQASMSLTFRSIEIESRIFP